jgi:hypothetical protein
MNNYLFKKFITEIIILIISININSYYYFPMLSYLYINYPRALLIIKNNLINYSILQLAIIIIIILV